MKSAYLKLLSQVLLFLSIFLIQQTVLVSVVYGQYNGGAPYPPPTVNTLGPSNITTTSAQLNGNLNSSTLQAHANAWFKWGPGPQSSYPSCTSLPNATSPVDYGTGINNFNYTAGINGLTAGATYTYCAVASNYPAYANYGALVEFQTNNAALTPDLLPLNLRVISANNNNPPQAGDPVSLSVDTTNAGPGTDGVSSTTALGLKVQGQSSYFWSNGYSVGAISPSGHITTNANNVWTATAGTYCFDAIVDWTPSYPSGSGAVTENNENDNFGETCFTVANAPTAIPTATTAPTAIPTVPAGSPVSGSCIVNPSSITTGQSATWFAQPTGGNGIYSYNWSGADGLSGTSQQLTWTYNTTGNKTGQLFISDSAGHNSGNWIPCTNSLNVSSTPQPTATTAPQPTSPSGPGAFSLNNPGTSCSGNSTFINNDWNPGSSGAVSYNIYRNGTYIISTSATHYNDGPLGNGTYSYYVIAFNSNNQSQQSSNTTNVTASCGVASPTPTTAPNGCSVNLTASPPNPNPAGTSVILSWSSTNDSDGSLTPADSMPAANYSSGGARTVSEPAGTYNFTLICVGPDGQSHPSTTTVTWTASANCNAIGDINTCSNTPNCAWYACSNSCWPQGTPNSTACPAPTATPTPIPTAIPSANPTPIPQPISASCTPNPSTVIVNDIMQWVAFPAGGNRNYAYFWSGNVPGGETTQSFNTSYSTPGPEVAFVYVYDPFNSSNNTGWVQCTPNLTVNPAPTATPTPSPIPSPTPSPTPRPFIQTSGGDVHSNTSIKTGGQ